MQLLNKIAPRLTHRQPSTNNSRPGPITEHNNCVISTHQAPPLEGERCPLVCGRDPCWCCGPAWNYATTTVGAAVIAGTTSSSRRETRALVPDDTIDLLRGAVQCGLLLCHAHSIQPGTGGSIHIHVPGRLQAPVCRLLSAATGSSCYWCNNITHTGYIHSTAGGKGLSGVPLPLLHPSALLITCITQGNNGGTGHGR